MAQKYKRPRCCGSAMVSVYIRHGKRSVTPGSEKIGLYCHLCRRFEVKEPEPLGLEEVIKKYPVMEHVTDALKPYMHTVKGLYLHGSRVRGDYRDDSDYDLVVISQDRIKREVGDKLEKYNVQLQGFTLKEVKKMLKFEPSFILTVLREGIPIIGADLQKQLLKNKFSDLALLLEIKDCKKQIKLLKKAMREYELDGGFKSTILYSAIIRLRRVYEIKKIYDNIPHLAEDFRRYYSSDFEHISNLFKKARDLPEGVDEADVPDEFKKMTKTTLKELVDAVGDYIKDYYNERFKYLENN